MEENGVDFKKSLHVLTTDSLQLKETYKYVIDSYGKEAINKNISILSTKKDIIIDVENLGINFVNKSDNLVLAANIDKKYATLEEIQKIIHSDEFREYPELFTAVTIARSTLEELQRIIQSKEFKEHRELFTANTIARSTLDDIQKTIQSDEFMKHPGFMSSFRTQFFTHF